MPDELPDWCCGSGCRRCRVEPKPTDEQRPADEPRDPRITDFHLQLAAAALAAPKANS